MRVMPYAACIFEFCLNRSHEHQNVRMVRELPTHSYSSNLRFIRCFPQKSPYNSLCSVWFLAVVLQKDMLMSAA